MSKLRESRVRGAGLGGRDRVGTAGPSERDRAAELLAESPVSAAPHAGPTQGPSDLAVRRVLR